MHMTRGPGDDGVTGPPAVNLTALTPTIQTLTIYKGLVCLAKT